MGLEQRQSTRYPMNMPVRIISIGGREVDLKAQTLDMGHGGVSFNTSGEIPTGSILRYEITLSKIGSGATISCSGRAVRCVASEVGYIVGATMATYIFARPKSV